MKSAQHIWILPLALFVVVQAACSSGDQVVKKAPVNPVPVTVESPLMSTDSSITVTGQVESAQSAGISTRVMGYITGILVKEGELVKQGQLLVTISDADIKAKLAQADAMLAAARANVNNAEKDYQRFTNLYKQQSASAKELDNVTLQYEAAKAGLQSATQMKAEANAMLAYTNIRAPFSGVVVKKLAEQGSMANPGMPILVLEQNNSLRVNASVPETDIRRIKLNAAAHTSIRAANTTYPGTVVEISPSSIATGGQYLVKISLPREADSELRSGMYAQVQIAAEPSAATRHEAVMIPVTALHHVGQLNALYLLSDSSTALLRYVRLGKTYGSQVEVLSGLNTDERFVVSAAGKLHNGIPVTVSAQ